MSTTRSSSRRNKIYALLAGGLVLGVGATVVLASWNDSEFATSNFTAGSFVFQGSPDGTTFTDHESEAGAANLTAAFAAGFLAPGDDVYAPYSLQLDASSTNAATLAETIDLGDLTGEVTATTRAVTSHGCDAAAFADGTPVPTSIAKGETIHLCLQVTADADLTQGATGSILWQWAAESID